MRIQPLALVIAAFAVSGSSSAAGPDSPSEALLANTLSPTPIL